MIFRKKPQILFSPMLGTFGGASIQGFKGSGGAIDYQLDTSGGAYWNNYNTSPNTRRSNTANVNTDGIAKIVLNGYGILFYGWTSQNSGSNLRSITLPSTLLNKLVDIEFVGTGGPNWGGGSGGTAGGCGGRLVHQVKNLSYGIKTGATNDSTQNSIGANAACNLELLESGRSGAICSAQHSPRRTSTQYGVPRNQPVDGSFPIYRTQGFSVSGYGSVDSSYVNTWSSLIRQRDSNSITQASRGGAGRGLNQFAGINASVSTGYGLGGGGGGQNSSQYGGSNSGESGGRYGYQGGNEASNGFGPPSTAGKGQTGTYTKGGGGAFGGGSGDAGNNSTECGSGGGAILMRWDTTEAYADVGFQSGRQGWP